MELLVIVNESEHRIEGTIYVAGYMTVVEAIKGLVESEIEGMEWESEEARQEAYDNHEHDYDDDEIYEAVTGREIPAYASATMIDGDLFLYAYEDCDTNDKDSIREAFEIMKYGAELAGIDITWLDADDAKRAGM